MAALSTLAIAGLTATAVGAGYSAYSQNQAGKAAEALNNYNAGVTQQAANYNADLLLQTSEYNAALAEMEASQGVAEGLGQAAAVRASGRRILASQRAKVAASGVAVGTGSPLAVEVAQAGNLELRALEVERQTGNAAARLRHEADQERSQGKASAAYERWYGGQRSALDIMEGASARRAGRNNAFATLLQGAGSAATGYANIKGYKGVS